MSKSKLGPIPDDKFENDVGIVDNVEQFYDPAEVKRAADQVAAVAEAARRRRDKKG